MRYDWDERKSRANKSKHGLAFDAVERFEWETAFIEIDDREDYGELRGATIAGMSDEEDARITAAALADPDAQPWTDTPRRGNFLPLEEHEKRMKRLRGKRGPQKAPTKQLVSLRIDPDVLEHFRATGPGWQGRINAALRKAARL